tara:strand:- start:46026 stop:46877 length:852 start_codon:yes stop_codon:yes gene_type:complete
MIISPSQVLKGQTCMKQVFFHYELGIRPNITSANLAFGKAVDSSVMDYLAALSTGTSLPSMEDVFLRHWKKETSIPLEYSATKSESKMLDIGVKMALALPEAWEKSELMVFTMPDGSPALQVKLAVQISKQDSLRGYLDLIALNQEGKVVIVDIKTTGVEYDDIYTLQSDQLTAYQILVDAHADRLGVERADKVGFMCLHKKTEPVIHQPQIVERRSQDRVQEYLDTCGWYIEDYNAGRFNRCSLGAFNSPCKMCDFKNLCSSGDTDDLIIPDRAIAPLKLVA